MKRHEPPRGTQSACWIMIFITATLIFCGQPLKAQAQSQWSTPDANDNIYNINIGNVGIGTTGPSYTLDVASANPTRALSVVSSAANHPATIYAQTSASASAASMFVENERGGFSSYGGFYYGGSADSAGNLFGGARADHLFVIAGGASNAGMVVGTISAQPLILGSNNAERVRIDSSGNVGVGTTNPATPLHVAAANADASTRVAQFYQPGLSTTNNYSFVSVGKANVADQAAAFGFLMNTAGNDSAFMTVAGDDPTAGTGLFVRKGGNVGIGTTNPQAALDVSGSINVSGNINARYSQDVAEWVPATHSLPAGTVVVLNPEKNNQVMASVSAYDTRVAGVVSVKPALALGEGGQDKVLVATTGRVKVKVDATRSPIHVGDLLVTSDTEGVAMKSVPVNLGGVEIHRPGTLIGKALEPLEKGTGEILVLLSLQ